MFFQKNTVDYKAVFSKVLEAGKDFKLADAGVADFGVPMDMVEQFFKRTLKVGRSEYLKEFLFFHFKIGANKMLVRSMIFYFNERIHFSLVRCNRRSVEIRDSKRRRLALENSVLLVWDEEIPIHDLWDYVKVPAFSEKEAGKVSSEIFDEVEFSDLWEGDALMDEPLTLEDYTI